MEALIQRSPRFEASLKSEINLEQLFLNAVNTGHLKAVNAIISSSHFRHISAAVRQDAFESVGYDENEEMAKSMIASPLFSTDDLNIGFVKAASGGCVAALKAIIQSPRFQEISQKSLEEALKEAAQWNHLEIFKAIMNSSKNQEIAMKSLAEILDIAVSRGGKNLIETIILSPFFPKILPKDIEIATLDSAFRTLFRNPIQTKDLPVVKAIIQAGYVDQISTKTLKEAYRESVWDLDLELMHMIIKSGRYAMDHPN